MFVWGLFSSPMVTIDWREFGLWRQADMSLNPEDLEVKNQQIGF